MKFSKELIEKAQVCKTAEELIALAKENNFELSLNEAKLCLRELAEGEVTDEELDNVAGGQAGCKHDNTYDNIYWKKEEDVQFIFREGDIVEAYRISFDNETVTCKVVNIKVEYYGNDQYADVYWLEKQPGIEAPFIKGWYNRGSIAK